MESSRYDQNKVDKIFLFPPPETFPEEDAKVREWLKEFSMQYSVELLEDMSRLVQMEKTCIIVINIFNVQQKPAKYIENFRKKQPLVRFLLLIDRDHIGDDLLRQFQNFKVDIIFKPATLLDFERYFNSHLSVSSKQTSISIKPVSQPEELLKGGEASFQDAKGVVPCPACKRWNCRQDDAFCARCGKPLAVLEIDENTIRFEPSGGEIVEHLITLKNIGINPLLMSFQVDARPYLADCFKLHTSDAMLQGGSVGKLLLTFNTERVDSSKEHRAALIVTSNESGTRKCQIDLVVERKPIPRFDIPEPFQLIIVNRDDDGWRLNNDPIIRLYNDGGGTLRLKGVTLSDQVMNFDAPIDVKAGESIPVSLSVMVNDVWQGPRPVQLKFSFDQLPSVERDARAIVIDPPRIATDPVYIDFKVVSSRRLKRLPVILRNTGGEELIINGINPAVPWVKVVGTFPLHLSLGISKSVEVMIDGTKAPPGIHSFHLIIDSNAYQAYEYRIKGVVRIEKPTEYEPYIGVDFGTTASCVAIIQDAHENSMSKPRVLEIDHDGDRAQSIMPSVLYFDDDGETLAGYNARAQAMIQPANAVSSIKRALGTDKKRLLAGREYTPKELAAKIIEQLVHRAEDALFNLGHYKTPYRAVVTVPVDFTDNQRRMLLESCSLAGLNMEPDTEPDTNSGVVIDEAQAAAFAYLAARSNSGSLVGRERLLIFDFGGGTLDCVVVEITQETEQGRIVFNTLAIGGSSRLGGEDIDWKLARYLAARAKESTPALDLACVSEEREFTHRYRGTNQELAAVQTRAYFKGQAEAAKIALSTDTVFEVNIPYLLNENPSPPEYYIVGSDGRRVTYKDTIRREDLDALLDDFIVRAEGIVEGVCRDAGLSPDEINTVLHVGRTSAIPLIKARIKRVLAKAEDRSELIEPKLCVASGAAFWGAIKDLPDNNIEFGGLAGRTLYDMGYIGVSRTGNFRSAFVCVIQARTQLPVEKEVLLSTRSGTLDLKIARSRSATEGPQIFYKVKIQNAQKEVPVLFRMDKNHMLTVTVNGEKQELISLDEE